VSNLSEGFRQALADLGITHYESLSEILAEEIVVGDVLALPGSSRMCWQVMTVPYVDGKSICIDKAIETRRGELMGNSRKFKFRSDETIRVMRP
jgi:hypothetical protein